MVSFFDMIDVILKISASLRLCVKKLSTFNAQLSTFNVLRARTPDPTEYTQNTRSTRMPPVTNRLLLPVFHGRDAHATRDFARTSLSRMVLCAIALTLAREALAEPRLSQIEKGRQIEAFAPENDGTGWAILPTSEPFFWSGDNFHKLSETPLWVSNGRFLGDASRGYYLQLYDVERCTKRIYRLINGEARLHCRPLSYEPDSEERYANTYIARDGRVVSWNTKRIAVWQGDAWIHLPADVAKDAGMPVFMEHNDRIVMVCARVAHVIHPDGRLTTWRFAGTSPMYDCVPWQAPVAIRLVRGVDAPEAFDMFSGEVLPLPGVFDAVREPVRRLMRASGGSVWAQTGSALYRLRLGGAAERLPIPVQGDFEVLAIDDPTPSPSGRPAGQSENGGWRVFFKAGPLKIGAWSPDGMVQWDEHQGLRGDITDVRVARDRSLWFIAGWQLFRVVFDETAAEPPGAGRDALLELYTLRVGTRLMDVGKGLALFPETGNVLKRWDGTAWSDQPWPCALSNGVLTDVAWDNTGVVYLCHGYRKAPLDTLTELRPDSAEVVSDAFEQDPFDKIWTALAKALDRGATALNRVGWEITVTPDKKIWALETSGGDQIRHFDGTLWRSVPVNGEAVEIMVRNRGREGYRVAVRFHDDRVRVYENGVFVETGEKLAPRPDKTIVSDVLHGSPWAGRPFRARYTDRAGNLWLELAHEPRVVCYRLANVRLSAQPHPVPGESASLTIQAATLPLFTSATFAVRFGTTNEWLSLRTPSGKPACIRFPCSGVYTCEVAATVFDVRLPQTVRFEYKAEVTFPETRLLGQQTQSEPIIVTDAAWRPPVEAVPTTFARRAVCQTVWRVVGSNRAWTPLDADGHFPLRSVETNGVYQLEFAACEEGTWRDPSPVTLSVRVALDDEGLLLITLDNLGSNDPRIRSDAEQRLAQNSERWLPLLRRLQKQADQARQRLNTLCPVFEIMRTETAE
jgi:hypothetical protein